MESKVVVITGASSGIGAALARELGARGNSLVLAARREELLKKVAGETGARTLTVETAESVASQIASLIERPRRRDLCSAFHSRNCAAVLC